MKFHFIFEPGDTLAEGFARVAPLVGVRITGQGMPVYLHKDAPELRVWRSGDEGHIAYSRKVEAFRGLSLLCQHWNEGDFSVCEHPRFDSCGLMADCSRGAVPKPQTIQALLCRMALMGANMLLLYTEDTYAVEGRPYFGYLRGRYTQQELRAMDDVADALGIEMVPCIQTLAHLERALQWWRPFVNVRDTENILYVGKPETYRFLDELITAASAPFRSKRIHIGMDEAFGLGLGRRLTEQGYHTSAELMKIHLEQVCDILHKHGLEAMMWSDMFFHASAPGSGAYCPGTKLTEEVIAQIPADITQVYWHYYSETEDTYDHFLTEHDRMPGRTAFAGGLWSWNGPATDYRKALPVAVPALRQCEKHHVRDVFVTAWIDDGAEANVETFLLGVQIYSEYNYTGTVEWKALDERFRVCAGASAQSFYDISLLNIVPGLPLQKWNITSVVKAMLYEDPLIPMFEKDFADLLDDDYFLELADRYEASGRQYPAYGAMFAFYRELARTVALKCRWHNRAAHAVRSNDRGEAAELCPLADCLIEQYRQLAQVWQTLWFADNKPFGFEVLDIRVGGCIQRMVSARRRMQQFADGEIADIEELRCEKLPYLKNDDGEIEGNSSWARIASASRIV